MARVIDFLKWDDHDSRQVQLSADPFARYIVDLSADTEPVNFLLRTADGTGLIPAGDLIGLKAKAKQGKTFVTSCIEVAALSGSFMGFTGTNDSARVLHIDSEQMKGTAKERQRTTYAMCGWDTEVCNERLVTLSLRAAPAAERREVAMKAIERYKPSLTVIDGIRDLLVDFNDIKESSALVNDLMRAASLNNTAIICVLHENKGDGNMRGMLGSELLNKSSEVYAVSRDADSGLITVDQTECRNAPIDKWHFRIDDNDMPVPAVAPAKVSKADTAQEKVVTTLRTVFMAKSPREYTDLCKAFGELYPCGVSWAKQKIAGALAGGMICKLDTGDYVLGDFGSGFTDVDGQEYPNIF